MQKTVEFIIPTFSRTVPLLSMLASLEAQTSRHWRANVVIDTDHGGVAEEIIKHIASDNIYFTYTGKQYNDFGHTPRQMGKQKSKADYIIMTGDDNYYVPTCVDEILKAAKDSPGMIYWDMVHSHYDYHYFKTSPGYNQIDMGAFATRRDLAHQIKLNTSYAADGEFVEEFKDRFITEGIVKIDKVLFVHN